jgi:hypothetical protein
MKVFLYFMQLPQRNNDFVIEYLKYEGRKNDGNIQYNYKVTRFSFC